jgi:hypothetical protein
VPKTNLLTHGILESHEGNYAKGVEPDPQFRQGYLAYRALAGALDGFSDACVPVAIGGLPANVAGYRFEEGARKTLVFWNSSSGTSNFTCNVGSDPLTQVNIWGEILASNLTGNVSLSVDGSPVYLTKNPMPQPYFIAGRISSTNSGAQVPNVTLTLSGPAAGTATSDTAGNYLLPDLPAGTYTVTPSVTNGGSHSFSPASVAAACSWTGTLGRVSFKMDNANPVLAAVTNRSVKPGSTLTVTLSAADPDNDPVSFTKNDGSVGTLAGAVFTYTPTAAEAGTTNSVTFTASDGLGGTHNRSAAITVERATAHGTRAEWLNYYQLAGDTGDEDGDGLLTWQEFYAGTDPTNAASVLKFVGAGLAGGSNYVQWLGGTNSFPYVTNPYVIQFCTNLPAPAGTWSAAGTNMRAPGTNTWWEPFHTSAPRRFYRIRVTN